MIGLPAAWRAAVLRRPGDDLEILDIARPALTNGQVLVELSYSGVCRSQLMETRGLRGADPWVPHLLGHEGVGIVREVGSGVTKVAVGDRVIVGWIVGEGVDAAPPVLESTAGERINAGRVTTFSEWTVVSENRVYACPPGLADRTAVLFGCALLTGAGMVMNELPAVVDGSLLINGLGGIGLAALIAASGTAATIVVTEPDAAKRRLATTLGAAHAFDPTDATALAALRSLFPQGVDVAIDASGTVAGIETAYSLVRYGGGELLFASHPPAGESIHIDPHDLIKGRGIRGSWGGGSQPDRDIPRLAATLAERGLSLNFLTPRTYGLAQVNEALSDLEGSIGMRPLIAMRGASDND